MKKSIFLFMFFVFMAFVHETKAQYNTGIGIRTGTGHGLTVKQFINETMAVEGLLYSRWGGLIVTGLFEVHNNIREVRGLDWYFGGGAHYGTWNAENRNTPWGDNRTSSSEFGLDAIIGLDYKFYNAPVNVSLDWKPAYSFGESGLWEDEIGISVRFAF